MNNPYDLSKMSSVAYAKAMQSSGKLIIALASIEVLGTHGPLGADWLVANEVVPRIAKQTGALYAPVIPYGDTLELPKAPGTVHINQDTLQAYYAAVAQSFLRDDLVKQLFFINFHSLNNRAIDAVCRQLAVKGIRCYVIDWWKTVGSVTGDLLYDKAFGTGHGGEMISSVMLHIAGESMVMQEQTNAPPLADFPFYKDHLPGGSSPFAAYGTFADYTEGSSWGDLSLASAEKGELLVTRAIKAINEFILSINTVKK